ncbi:helix-turn-helix domain-containing protein [Streptomyces sp. NPDC002889]|uniref:helix-turn-helix domain-containing protein n=1 Tax=Streptomyces sp. NPDC002889 TaxID=3364669 RepID=UPI0036814E4A
MAISAGKMSGVWCGRPVSLELEDLDVICVVLGFEIGDHLIAAPEKVSAATVSGVPLPTHPRGSAGSRSA